MVLMAGPEMAEQKRHYITFKLGRPVLWQCTSIKDLTYYDGAICCVLLVGNPHKQQGSITLCFRASSSAVSVMPKKIPQVKS